MTTVTTEATIHNGMITHTKPIPGIEDGTFFVRISLIKSPQKETIKKKSILDFRALGKWLIPDTLSYKDLYHDSIREKYGK